jgi:hypothetical protein
LTYALNTTLVNDPSQGADPAAATYSWTQPEQIIAFSGIDIIVRVGDLSDPTIADPTYTAPDLASTH